MILRVSLGALASLSLLLGAGTALAGANLDRSDLMDLNDTFEDDDAGSDNRVRIEVREYETTSNYEVHQAAHVAGRVRGDPDSGSARLYWLMFEMDALDRSKKKLSMKQKDEVGWYAQYSLPGIGYQSTFPYSPDNYFTRIEGCSASVKVKGTDGDPESAKWKFKCKDSFGEILDQLGLSEDAQDEFATAFDLDLNKKPKGKGKGELLAP